MIALRHHVICAVGVEAEPLARWTNRSPNTAIGAVPGMTVDPPTPARNGFARRGAASVFVADVAKGAGQ
jgi:hypothetical protein